MINSFQDILRFTNKNVLERQGITHDQFMHMGGTITNIVSDSFYLNFILRVLFACLTDLILRHHEIRFNLFSIQLIGFIQECLPCTYHFDQLMETKAHATYVLQMNNGQGQRQKAVHQLPKTITHDPHLNVLQINSNSRLRNKSNNLRLSHLNNHLK